MRPAEVTAAHELLRDCARGIVHDHHVIAVPPYAAADMQQELRHELQHRRYFVGQALGGVKVPGVQAEQLLPGRGVAHVELVRADDVGFGADAEQLAFDGVQIVRGIERLLENFVESGLQPFARRFAIHGNVF